MKHDKYPRQSVPTWRTYYQPSRGVLNYPSWTVIHGYGDRSWLGMGNSLGHALKMAKYHERIERYP